MTRNHTNRAFDNELRLLRDRILLIAGRVERMVANTIKSLAESDTCIAHTTIEYAKGIYADEKLIDRLCIELLAQRQPLGQDLRFIVSVIKMVGYFERLGDLVVNICRCVVNLSRISNRYEIGDMVDMAKGVQSMITEILDAFLYRDANKAYLVIQKDDTIDEIYHFITKRLIDEMNSKKVDVENSYHLLSIAKWLERMGDHCIHLAEIVIYMVKGENIYNKARIGS